MNEAEDVIERLKPSHEIDRPVRLLGRLEAEADPQGSPGKARSPSMAVSADRT